MLGTAAEAYFQLGELMDKIDDKEALAIHRKAPALRRELAAAEGPDVETRLNVARSLAQVGLLLYSRGDNAGAVDDAYQYGNLLDDVQVTFTAPSKGASGTFAASGSPAQVVVSTDAQGIANAPVLTANASVGAFSVTASVAGVKKSVYSGPRKLDSLVSY